VRDANQPLATAQVLEGVAKNTISKLLLELGTACSDAPCERVFPNAINCRCASARRRKKRDGLSASWRMQKAMQSLQQRDKKFIDVARSVTSPTLRSARRSSELSGPTLMNTANVVLKATVIPEWRKILEAEDSDFCGGPGCHGSVLPLSCGPKCPRHHQRELFSPECATVRSSSLIHDDIRI
jgi:hypothetical protein